MVIGQLSLTKHGDKSKAKQESEICSWNISFGQCISWRLTSLKTIFPIQWTQTTPKTFREKAKTIIKLLKREMPGVVSLPFFILTSILAPKESSRDTSISSKKMLMTKLSHQCSTLIWIANIIALSIIKHHRSDSSLLHFFLTNC